MEQRHYSDYSLQELMDIYTRLSQWENNEEAKIVAEYIMLKKKETEPGNILATPWERLGAFIIDLLVIIVPFIVLMTLLDTFSNATNMSYTDGFMFAIAIMFICGLIYMVVNIWLLYKYGQTAGKRIIGIKILDQENNKPSLVKSFLIRTIVPVIILPVPVVGILFFITDALFIFRQDRRCLHDLIAGTKVVIAEKIHVA